MAFIASNKAENRVNALIKIKVEYALMRIVTF